MRKFGHLIIDWTPENVARLIELHFSGKSGSQIAAEFGQGLTRNAAIGKWNRLRKAGHLTKDHAMSLRSNPAVVVPKACAESEPTRLLRIEATGSAAEAVFALTSHSCRWPEGDPCSTNFRFCGEVKPFDVPYCLHHRELSLGSGTPSERRAVRDAKGVV